MSNLIAALAGDPGSVEIAGLARQLPSLLLVAWLYAAGGCYAALSLLDQHPPAEPLRRWRRRLVAALIATLGFAAAFWIALATVPVLRDDPGGGLLLGSLASCLAGALLALTLFDQRARPLPFYALAGGILGVTVGLAQHLQLHAALGELGPGFDPQRWLLGWTVVVAAGASALALASYLRRRRSGSPIFLTVVASAIAASGLLAHHLMAVNALRGQWPAAPHAGLTDPASVLVLAATTGVALLVAAVFATARRRREQPAEAQPSSAGNVRRGSRSDPASGLPTLEVLAESFVRVQRLAVAGHGGVALAVIHLNGLDRIESTQGPQERDRLFGLAAWRLRSLRRDEELLGALGDNRFLMVLRVSGGEEASQRMRELTTLFETPLCELDLSLRIRPGVGVSLWPEHGDEFSRLLANALVALERCPADGVQVFHATQREESERRLRLESTLSGAIARGELGLVFQPVVDALSGEVRMVELLARWNSAEMGVIPPKQFILIAESSGLIAEFDRWLVREAIATTKWLDAAGFVDVRVAMNCSPVNLSDPSFMAFAESTLRGSGIDCGRIEVEVTEAALAEGDRMVVDSLLRLRELGVGLTIDDFGIGHSSLARLRDLPVDTLKIDQSFVRDMDHPKGEFLVSGILGLAHGLGKAVVAEGVETEAQRTALSDLGCEYLQGYLIARPLSWRGLLDFLGEGGEGGAESTVQHPADAGKSD